MSIGLEGVTVRYGGIDAVRNISLAVAAGEILALIGPNGSGKSSLLKAIAGMVPHAGRISHANAGHAGHWREHIGYMPQDNGARASLTVIETVLLGLVHQLSLRIDATAMAKVAMQLGELGITHLANRAIGDLSGGQRQLVFLAQTLVRRPSILLLDEPISALDLQYQVHVLDVLRRLTRCNTLTTIVVMHDLNMVARFADRVAVLLAGEVAAEGIISETLLPPVIARCFGVEALVEVISDGKPVIVARALREGD